MTSTSISARISTYLPGSEMPSSNVSLPLGVTGTFMKKLMLLVMSRLVMPWPHSADRLQKAAAASVHVALLDGIAHHVAFIGAGAAQRVMPSACVRNDGHQHVALREISLRSGCQINIPLLANRVLRAVAIGIVMRVVKQRVDGLIAMKVYDPEILPGFAAHGSTVLPRAHRLCRPLMPAHACFAVVCVAFIGNTCASVEAAFILGSETFGRDHPPQGRVRGESPAGPAWDHTCGPGSIGCWHVFRIVRTFISARSSTEIPAPSFQGRSHLSIEPNLNLAEEIDIRHEVART